jgi:hypothetical protein
MNIATRQTVGPTMEELFIKNLTQTAHMTGMEASLRDLLKHGRTFERLHTSKPGIFVRKIPPSKNDPAYLAVEINPVGPDGFPKNKIGVIIRNQEELDAIRAILVDKKVDEILQIIRSLVP